MFLSSRKMNFVEYIFLIIIVSTLTEKLINGQSIDSSENSLNDLDSIPNISDFDDQDYIDNEIDMKATYRSNIEKILQIFVTILNIREPIFNLNKLITTLLSTLPAPFRDFLTLSSNDDTEVKTEKAFQLYGIINDLKNGYGYQTIYPGTLWCGDGNIAKSMSHLGTFWKTDNCCRQHDSCPFYIEAGEYLGLLKNNGIFTRSACLCDFQFYKCLKNVNTVISRNVGITYFNILRPQCFSYDYPIKYCKKYDSSRKSNKKCIQYKLDESRNKTLEWFDLPDF